MAVTAPARPERDPLFRLGLAGLVAIALGLRIANARGGLWVDEAWSLVFAREVGTPLGILLSINHDNNHHLNTLWLQLTGLGAPSLLSRALSVATGTAATWLAGLIEGRRSAKRGLVAAALFAVSPILVTYGSEARGYAPMLLALLAMLWLVDGWLEKPGGRPPAAGLAACAALGMLAHLEMLVGIVAVSGWAVLRLARGRSPRQAVTATVRLLGPAMIAVAAVLAAVASAGWMAPDGFVVGSYTPFAWRDLAAALFAALAYGWGMLGPMWLVPLVVALALGGLLAAGSWPKEARWSFTALATLPLPAAVALLAIGNSGFARYHLVGIAALLLATAAVLGTALEARGWRRMLAGTMLGLLLLAGGAQDARLIGNLRGDPSAAVRLLGPRAPAGTTVAIPFARDRAVLLAAAAQLRYPLRIVEVSCPPAPYLFASWPENARPAAAPVRCGRRYAAIAGGQAIGLSGMDWTLYAALPGRQR